MQARTSGPLLNFFWPGSSATQGDTWRHTGTVTDASREKGDIPRAQTSILSPLFASICGMSDVTKILDAIDAGDPHAAEQLLPLVYDELRKLAAGHMANESPGHTLDATALVHEASVRTDWPSRGPDLRQSSTFFSPPPLRQCMASLSTPLAADKLSSGVDVLEHPGSNADP